MNKSKNTVSKCNILPSDKIFFGSGGSHTIIIITERNQVYKFFPIYFYEDDPKYNVEILRQNTQAKREIAIGRNISKYILDKGVSPHYVKFYGYNECAEISKVFKKCPDYLSYLKSKKYDPICTEKYKGYPSKGISDEYMVVSMEYCDYPSSKFIEDLSRKSIEYIEYYLDIFIFQIYYTILATKKIYPYFSHRDLFLRNILGIKQNPSSRYYRYTIDKVTYDIPVEFFMPKISDYGLTNLNEKYHETKLYSNDVIDFFNFTYDIYDGGNLGAQSLKSLFKSNETKLKFLDKYFKTFFNPKKISELKSNKTAFMNWNWSHIRDDKFRSYIEFVKPEIVMKKYFSKKFPFNPEHEIEQEFYV